MIDAKETVWIACASDDAYALPLAVTLQSALSHASNDYKWHIVCLDGGLRCWSKMCLRHLVKQSSADAKLSIISPSEKPWSAIATHGHLTEATFYRLALPRLLSGKTDRVIYLDCDLVVQEDLSKLWTIPFDGKPCLAVRGFGAPYVSDTYGVPTWREQGMPHDTPCLNAGVVVMDIAKWDREGIPGKVVSYLAKREDNLTLNDQLGINAVLQGNWGQLDPRWNQSHPIFSFDGWPESPFKEELRPFIEDLTERPFIIHYTSASKPWHAKCDHPLSSRFHEVLDSSPLLRRFFLIRKLWERVANGFKRRCRYR